LRCRPHRPVYRPGWCCCLERAVQVAKYTPAMHAHYERLQDLTTRQAKLYLLLLHYPGKTMLGVMRVRLSMWAGAVGSRAHAVSVDLDALASQGLLTWDSSASVLRVSGDSEAGQRWTSSISDAEQAALEDYPQTSRPVVEALEILRTKQNSKPTVKIYKTISSEALHDTTPTPTPTKNTPPTPPRGKTRAKSKPFIPPTLGECVEFAAAKGWGEQFAVGFFEFFTADAGRMWVASKGSPVSSWKQKMLTWSRFKDTKGAPGVRPQTIEEKLAACPWGDLSGGGPA